MHLAPPRALLVLRFLLPLLASAAPARAQEKVHLDTLEPLEAFVSFDRLWTNQTKRENDAVEVDGKPASRFLIAHANSRLVYQVPPGATRFQAVGVATTRFRSNSSWFYEVWADTSLLFRSRPLREYENRQVTIDVELPRGTQRVMLVADNHGNSAEDHSVWAEPCFVVGGSRSPSGPRNLISKLPSAQLDGVVLIEGGRSSGTGFFAVVRGQPFVVTNQHVLAGNKTVRIGNRTGIRPNITGYVFAKDRDLALVRIDADPATLPLLKLAESATSAEVGAEVLIAGNSEGGGTILQSEGRVIAFGFDRLEHDAPSVAGNSGSPVFDQATWEVVAIDTYARVRRATASTDPASRSSTASSMSDFRHFGVRIDSAQEWQTMNWDLWQRDCTELENIERAMEGIEKLLTEPRTVWITYPEIASRVQSFEAKVRGDSPTSPGFQRAAASLFQDLLNFAQSQNRAAQALRARSIGYVHQRADNLASYATELEAVLKAWDVNVADRLRTESVGSARK